MLRLPGPARGLRIGVFGGSFNPAHDGHRHVAETALKRLDLDWVWWVVARGNPLKGRHGAFADRLASARAVADHPRMRVTDIEAQIGTVYTTELLRALAARCPETRFVWLMGADNLKTFHRWKGWREIMATTPIAVIARPGAGPSARTAKAFEAVARARHPAAAARTLADQKPPAWVYLSAPWNAMSSTALRRRARRRRDLETKAAGSDHG